MALTTSSLHFSSRLPYRFPPNGSAFNHDGNTGVPDAPLLQPSKRDPKLRAFVLDALGSSALGAMLGVAGGIQTKNIAVGVISGVILSIATLLVHRSSQKKVL